MLRQPGFAPFCRTYVYDYVRSSYRWNDTNSARCCWIAAVARLLPVAAVRPPPWLPPDRDLPTRAGARVGWPIAVRSTTGLESVASTHGEGPQRARAILILRAAPWQGP
jgi:hypothetical protein